jgi:chromosome segregation ATPase
MDPVIEDDIAASLQEDFSSLQEKSEEFLAQLDDWELYADERENLLITKDSLQMQIDATQESISNRGPGTAERGTIEEEMRSLRDLLELAMKTLSGQKSSRKKQP